MKALSVKQPFASLIVSGIKDVENRSYNCHYRGKLLIHASLKPMKFELEVAGQATAKEILMSSTLNEAEENNWFGCIVGEVEIVNVMSKWLTGVDSKSQWAVPGAFHWILRNPVMYDRPIYVKGRLGLWNYDKQIVEP